MLSSFRTLGNQWFTKVFLFLLAFSFVGWGITDYISGGNQGSAMRVNGTKISLQQIDRAYQNTKQNLENTMGSTLTADMLAEAGVPTRVLVTLLQETLLQQAADELHLAAPTQALKKVVEQNPAFTKNGKFEIEAYKAALRSIGYTPEGYETEQRKDMRRRLLSGIFYPYMADAATLTRAAAEALKTVDVQVAKLTPAMAGNVGQPTAEELQAYYTNNVARYTVPEQRNLTVLVLDGADLAKKITISDAQAEAYYAANPDKFAHAEERKARQMMLPDVGTAEAVLAELKAGADFAEIARAKSTDTATALRGGDIGWVKRTDIIPAFADALFALKEGEVSAPVESPVGIHLIQLDEIKPAGTIAYADAKADLLNMMKLEEAVTAFEDLQEQMEDRIAAGDKLAAIAADNGLTAREITAFSQENLSSLDSALIPVALTTPEGQTSSAIPLGQADNEALTGFVEVTKVTPAAAQPLEAVRTNVAADWTHSKRLETIQNMANQVAATVPQVGLTQALRNMKTPAQLTDEKGISKTLTGDAAWLTPDTRAQLLRLPVGRAVVQGLGADGVAIVTVTKVHTKTPSADDIKSQQNVYESRMANELLGQYIGHAAKNAKMAYNLPQLRLVFGENFTENQIPKMDTK
ncbi:MAG: SurA N-terminal domain-containing protein [Alphaproteobacteria bacterium]